MTGREQNPDYGRPEQTWKGTLFLILLIATICGAMVLAFFGQM
jgi:hypothetical protein